MAIEDQSTRDEARQSVIYLGSKFVAELNAALGEERYHTGDALLVDAITEDQ